MEQPTVVTRSVEVEMSPEELWSLLGDGARWADWLVDESDIDVTPDGEGAVRDAGVDRGVRIDEVIDGERVRFDWWPTDRPDSGSTVELVVAPRQGGAVLHIVETFPPQRHVAIVMGAVSASWDVRAMCLWACSLSMASAVR